jgi:hypothetical protein
MPSLRQLLLLLSCAGLGACGGGSVTDPLSRVDCDHVLPTALAAGAHAIIDPASNGGCLRLPAAGAGGAEYLVVALSANGQETARGVSGSFSLLASVDTFAPTPPPSGAARASDPVEASAFHTLLRERERELASRSRVSGSGSVLRRLVAPPTVGSTRSFKVCQTQTCSGFVSVRATAQYVGSRSAIFVDDTVPANGYSPSDIQTLGTLFDQHLYPIDTLAFGRESDLDGNGVVLILLTDQVNALSPACQQTGQVILGYFFGLDLDVTDPNSNGGELFYGPVPDPSKPLCFSKSFVLRKLAPTAIHEFQHMISFNRHVLLGGGAPEETWLNEGLSHFAEELGGRQVPNSFCSSGNCLDDFAAGNLRNAFDYLLQPASSYLVEPGSSSGTLAERGANWLFVRWLADRSPSDSLLGTDVTRALEGADQPGGLTATGGTNATQAAQLFEPGASFPTLAGQWHLANYLDAITGFTEPSGYLDYRSWDLKAAFGQVLPGPYPLRPDSSSGQAYGVSGTLRGGSGSYLRIVQPAGAAAVAVGLQTTNTAALVPRFAVIRIR